MSKKTEYFEPHPCSTERKRELQLKGYKVVDDRFKPAGWADPLAPKKRKQKVAEEAE